MHHSGVMSSLLLAMENGIFEPSFWKPLGRIAATSVRGIVVPLTGVVLVPSMLSIATEISSTVWLSPSNSGCDGLRMASSAPSGCASTLPASTSRYTASTSTTPSSSTLYVAFTTKMSVIRCRIWPWARPRPWPLLVSPRADVLGVDI